MGRRKPQRPHPHTCNRGRSIAALFDGTALAVVTLPGGVGQASALKLAYASCKKASRVLPFRLKAAPPVRCPPKGASPNDVDVRRAIVSAAPIASMNAR